MKKAVAHLIPFMEKEREEKMAEFKKQGIDVITEVRYSFLSIMSYQPIPCVSSDYVAIYHATK